MRLTVQIKLLPTPEQADRLRSTRQAFNAAANEAARVGFQRQVFGQVNLHHACYHAIRERFGLPAQLSVRAIGKAVECFRRDKKTRPTFKAKSAVVYDQRVMRLTEDYASSSAPMLQLPIFQCPLHCAAINQSPICKLLERFPVLGCCRQSSIQKDDIRELSQCVMVSGPLGIMQERHAPTVTVPAGELQAVAPPPSIDEIDINRSRWKRRLDIDPAMGARQYRRLGPSVPGLPTPPLIMLHAPGKFRSGLEGYFSA